ncbi:hypothetical protein H8959_006374, partial [Pygathrix nigripes]
QTEDNPRVAQVSITKCNSDMNGYCLHGQCIYLVDMSQNYCRCEVGYTGVRCEHFYLTVHQPLSKEYVALTVILIILFLIIVVGSTYYFCRCASSKPQAKFLLPLEEPPNAEVEYVVWTKAVMMRTPITETMAEAKESLQVEHSKDL